MTLPSLPAGWSYRPIKRVADLRFSSVDKHSLPNEEPVRLCNYLDVYRHDRISADLDFMEATASRGEHTRFALRPDDVLVTKDSEDPMDIAVPALVVDSLPGVLCGYHLALLRPHPEQMCGRFLHRALSSSGIRDQFFSKAVGITRYALGLSELGDSLVPVPPLGAQRFIAAFLDRKTAAIDALIAKKERLIELLEEKRQALIKETVTQGLDPRVPLRESGLGWAPLVPAHWDVAKICLVARLESGHTPSRQHPEYWHPDECAIPWFSLADVWQLRSGRREYLGDTAEKISPLGIANSAARLLPAGTVVLSRTASVGLSGIMPIPMATTQDFANWVCGPRLTPEYLLYCFRGMASEFARMRMGSTHQTIYMPDVRRLAIPVPSRQEQEEIVHHLRMSLGHFDNFVDKLNRSVALLAEYRQALISESVSGKIEVPTEEAA